MQHALRTDMISKGLFKLTCIFTLAVHLRYSEILGGGIFFTGRKLVGSPLGRLCPVEIFVTKLHTAKTPTER